MFCFSIKYVLLLLKTELVHLKLLEHHVGFLLFHRSFVDSNPKFTSNLGTCIYIKKSVSYIWLVFIRYPTDSFLVKIPNFTHLSLPSFLLFFIEVIIFLVDLLNIMYSALSLEDLPPSLDVSVYNVYIILPTIHPKNDRFFTSKSKRTVSLVL